jgi:two-component system, cell cycle sensor histidine kinase and response regulator CckA
MKVIIIDSKPGNHSSIAEILIKRGCDLLEVSGSEAALRVAQKEKPDIAIVNMLTPNLDRRDFVRQLRLVPASSLLPVIFYTEGYLEIASGLAGDMETLLTPILLCEEAIRGKVNGEANGSVIPLSHANGKGDENETCQNGSGDIQELFTFAPEEDGDRGGIRPADLIGAVVDEARKTFPKSIEITSAYSHDLWLIEGDRRQLHSVLSNLFLNARAGMSHGGSLLVSARNFNVDQRYASMTMGARPGRYVMFRVSDTGRGTGRRAIDKFFSPFPDRAEVGPGTSLGLLKSHGGFMSVYSNVERGTTCQIFLPAKVDEGSLHPAAGANGTK